MSPSSAGRVPWGVSRSHRPSAAACRIRTARIRGSICSSARSARTRCGRSAARSATKGRGAPPLSSGPRTRRTRPAEAERVEARARLVRQPSLDLPDEAERFAESSCLKCHHEVAELEPSERFPEPPAPKLVRGLRPDSQTTAASAATRSTASTGPNRRIGPDLRTEPNYCAGRAGHCLADCDELEPTSERSLAPSSSVAASRATRSVARRQLTRSALRRATARSEPGRPADGHVASWRRCWTTSRRRASCARSVPACGTWQQGRLRLPVLLDSQAAAISGRRQDAAVLRPVRSPANERQAAGTDAQSAFEPIEIRGIVEYLLAKSQPFEYFGSRRRT